MDSDTKIRTLTDASLVRVVIPIYKNTLNELEETSLRQTFKTLKNHHFSIVCPEGLDIQPILSVDETIKPEIIRFSEQYFKSIEGYNSLMLSDEFYEKFLESKYILICQTDVMVIKDELEHWCSKNYDYIGAPWIGKKQSLLKKYIVKASNAFKKIIGKKPKGYEHLFKVGNGGFSLRNVKKHYQITNQNKELIQYYIKNKEPQNYHIEDVFFSFKGAELLPGFTIPNYIEGLKFAIDRKPKIALKLNNNNLPFAIHGFDKPKVRDFWRPIISKIVQNNQI